MPLLSMTIKILSTWHRKNNGTGDDHVKLMEPADSSEIQITVGPRYGHIIWTQMREWHILKPGIYRSLLDHHSLPEHKTLR